MADQASVMAAVEPLIEPLARRMYSESCVTDGEYMSSVRRFPEYQRLADAVAEAIAHAVGDAMAFDGCIAGRRFPLCEGLPDGVALCNACGAVYNRRYTYQAKRRSA